MIRRHVAGVQRASCHDAEGGSAKGNADSTIVDFFLQAHTALQGTAKPSHYVVILDEMKLGAEELQMITHHL